MCAGKFLLHSTGAHFHLKCIPERFAFIKNVQNFLRAFRQPIFMKFAGFVALGV